MIASRIRLSPPAALLLLLLAITGAGRGLAAGFDELAALGLSYTNERTRVPWSIHVLKVDRARPELTLMASKARDRVIGLARLSVQMKAVPPKAGEPLAAINGDFYQTERSPYAGDPRGLMIVRGELISAPTANPCFWIGTDREPFIGNVTSRFRVTWPNGRETPFGLNEERRNDAAVLYTPTLGRSTMTRGVAGRELVLERDGANDWLPLEIGRSYQARVREVRPTNNTVLAKDVLVLSLGPQLLAQLPQVRAGDVITLSTATTPDLAGVPTAIGGGPKLVENGKATPPEKADSTGRNASYSVRTMFERHPRSAIGFNQSHVFLVEVDGRQPGLSLGMTLEELAKYMAKLGCTEAMNLDGGASSQMIVGDKVVNSPSARRERDTATGLVVVRKPKQ